VLNLSFSAPPQSYYWDDPLNQAVMAAWQAGIVVVASAGNTGPDPMTIGVPGNVPYVITVGAMTDNYSPEDPDDDMMAYWSSAGPTFEAFVKPDLVAPGGHLSGHMPPDGTLPTTYPEFYDNGQYFMMSGTSQAAAVVSGVAALLLQDEPGLSPDDVKCRLMATTQVGIYGNGKNAGDLHYSPFQQGAGRVDAYAAVHGELTGCANGGLDIDQDLAGTEHYIGPTLLDRKGNYYIDGVGYKWDGRFFQHGDIWVDGSPFVDGNPFVDGSPFVDGNGMAEPAAINVWVWQE
jgi:serine protease AprX